MATNDNDKKGSLGYEATHKSGGQCPHCGYCPTCGRSNSGWYYQYPYTPYYPWTWQVGSAPTISYSASIMQ